VSLQHHLAIPLFPCDDIAQNKLAESCSAEESYAHTHKHTHLCAILSAHACVSIPPAFVLSDVSHRGVLMQSFGSDGRSHIRTHTHTHTHTYY